jgi:hypothetical protein
MPGPAILRGAAAALLLSLASISAASADHRAGHGDLFYGKSRARMHAPFHRAPAFHHGYGMRPGHHRGIGHPHYGLRHHRFHVRHHARAAFPHGRYGFGHHGVFHGAAYGDFRRKRFFRVHGHGYGGHGHGRWHGHRHGYGGLRYAVPAYYYPYGHGVSHGYGASYGTYPTLAYGTVAGAAPYGPLYNRPAGLCY